MMCQRHMRRHIIWDGKFRILFGKNIILYSCFIAQCSCFIAHLLHNIMVFNNTTLTNYTIDYAILTDVVVHVANTTSSTTPA